MGKRFDYSYLFEDKKFWEPCWPAGEMGDQKRRTSEKGGTWYEKSDVEDIDSHLEVPSPEYLRLQHADYGE